MNLGLFQHDSNVIWDLAVHDLSIMDYLIDARPVWSSADGTAAAGFDHENIAYVTVHFDNGLPRALPRELARAGEDPAACSSGASQRMLVYDDTDPSEKLRVYDKGVDLDVKDEQTRRKILVSYRTGDMHAPKLDRREALSLVVREFADAIAERRHAPLTDAAAGIRVVTLLEAAERSLRSPGPADSSVKFQSHRRRRQARQGRHDLRLRQSLRLRDRRRDEDRHVRRNPEEARRSAAG